MPNLTYLIVRVHGLRLHLISAEQMLSLARTPDMGSFVAALRNTEYAPEVAELGEKAHDPSALEKAFYKRFAHRATYLIRTAPDKFAAVLMEYARRIEVENVARILRAKHAGKMVTRDNLLPEVEEATTVNFDALLKAASVAEVLDALLATPYSALYGMAKGYEESKDLSAIEFALRRIYYAGLWSAAERSPSKALVKQFVGTEIDLKNLATILSMKSRGAEAAEVLNAVIAPYFRLRRQDIEALSTAPKEQVLSLLARTAYSNLVPRLKEAYERGEVLVVERIVGEELLKYAFSELYREPLSPSYVLGYITLCEFEARNLTTIAIGKYLGIGGEKLERLLFLARR